MALGNTQVNVYSITNNVINIYWQVYQYKRVYYVASSK